MTKKKKRKTNMWDVIENVVAIAIKRGQLLVMAFSLFFIILVIKIPPEDVRPIIEKLLDVPKYNSILGWCVAILIAIAAVLITGYQRKIHKDEIKRISNEKTSLQQILIPKKLPTSLINKQ